MKSYYHHDPILDKGKASPKPLMMIGGWPAHYRKLHGWKKGPNPRSTVHNSRVRQLKKRRIVLRDLSRVEQNGFGNFVDGFTSVKRRVRAATESFLRSEPGWKLRVAAGLIDPNR